MTALNAHCPRAGYKDIENLQLAHWTCNRQKSDKIFKQGHETKQQVIGNRNLPQSMDWTSYNQTAQKQENTKTVIRIKKKKVKQ